MKNQFNHRPPKQRVQIVIEVETELPIMELGTIQVSEILNAALRRSLASRCRKAKLHPVKDALLFMPYCAMHKISWGKYVSSSHS